MSSKANFIQRLAFIKYLYNRANEQSRFPEPFCSLAVLWYHDAVELFLGLVAERVDAKIGSNIGFMDYFDAIAQAPQPIVLSQKSAMTRLNKARVTLKHYGVRPIREDINSLRIGVGDFLEENTTTVFKHTFSRISLADMILNTEVKDLLKQAETYLEDGHPRRSIDRAYSALESLLVGFERNRSKESEFRHIGFRSRAPSVSRSGGSKQFANDQIRELQQLSNYVSELSDAVTLIGWGIDYRKYSKFLFHHLRSQVSDSLSLFADEEGHSIPKPDYHADAQFCIDFVIESALVLQDFELSMTGNATGNA